MSPQECPQIESRRPDRSGRDEMNLAEFPLAVLSQRVDKGVLKFNRKRTLLLPDGSALNQEWIVTGDPEYGLPQPVDEDVLLGLLKIAADDGFTSPTVRFSQRGLLGILRWKQQGWYYARLEQALSRLTTTTVKAKNAFWNNESKIYQTLHFGIIEAYELYERQGQAVVMAARSNMARFSREFFSSIQAGYLKPLDLNIYFGLKRALSKRLYRYLDKKRYRKQRFEIGLELLGSVHMGLSESTCRYASWMKKEFDRAHQELLDAGFLLEASYEKTREGDWKVVYTFNPRVPKDEQLILPQDAPLLDITAPPSPQRPPERPSESPLVQQLVDRGLTPATARDIVAGKPAEFIQRQLSQFDSLRTHKSRAVRNPIGFLARALQEEWDITVPPEPAPAAASQSVVELRTAQEAVRVKQQDEADAVARVRAALEPDVLEALRQEAAALVTRELGGYRLGAKGRERLIEGKLYTLIQQRYLES